MKPDICFCFKYTEDDIIRDIKENDGRSTILERIKAEKVKSNCQCEFMHPEKRCCLADVSRVADMAKKRLPN